MLLFSLISAHKKITYLKKIIFFLFFPFSPSHTFPGCCLFVLSPSNDSYHGNDCGIGGHLKMELFGPKCLDNCTGHGMCDGGECLCHLDWVGKACELPALCPANCSGHGLCQHSQCFCDPGFNGTSCAIYSGCLPGNGMPDCHGRGECQHGQCFCTHGFDGDACEIDEEEVRGFFFFLFLHREFCESTVEFFLILLQRKNLLLKKFKVENFLEFTCCCLTFMLILISAVDVSFSPPPPPTLPSTLCRMPRRIK